MRDVVILGSMIIWGLLCVWAGFGDDCRGDYYCETSSFTTGLFGLAVLCLAGYLVATSVGLV